MIILGEKKQLSASFRTNSTHSRQQAQQKIGQQNQNVPNKFSIFCLNIEDCTKSVASWMKYSDGSRIGSGARILYSLLLGKGELIVFGGIRKEQTLAQERSEDYGSGVCNEVLFIKPPQGAI